MLDEVGGPGGAGRGLDGPPAWGHSLSAADLTPVSWPYLAISEHHRRKRPDNFCFCSEIAAQLMRTSAA